MFARIFMTMWSCVCLWMASHVGEYSRAGPLKERTPAMAEERKPPDVPERATKAVTGPMTVPLNEFVLKPELYCHRDPEDLTNRDRLLPLMDSLTVEGLLNPVEIFRDPDGKPVVTKGHRRISAMRQLAKKKSAGFTEANPVQTTHAVT